MKSLLWELTDILVYLRMGFIRIFQAWEKQRKL